MKQKQPRQIVSLLVLSLFASIIFLAAFIFFSQRQYALGASQTPASGPPHQQNVYEAEVTSSDAGAVRFFKNATSAFDVYTLDPDLEQQIWMQEHFWRMLTYPPYFDSRLSWYPDAWAYKDLYAIYVGSDLAGEHPEWILRDVDGHKLYIPWGCSEGTCPQYAADIGSPEFRTYWITEATNALASGYIGLWVDDVNLTWRVSDGDENFVNPIDPRTGISMTLADWQRYFAEFVEEIQTAFGQDYEIVHNVIWFADSTDNPYIIREVDAADYINLERGINDSGLVGGDGPFGLETFFEFTDFIHDRGKNVLFLANAANISDREYGLAGWLLISGVTDGFSSDPWSTPDDWWTGYELDIGAALGDRYVWQQFLRRNFECGIVLLNQPDSPVRDEPLGETYVTLDGEIVSSIALGSATGAILLKPCAKFGDQTVYMPEFVQTQLSAHAFVGTEATYELVIMNSGITTDVYTLSTGGNVWPTDLPSSVGPMSAGSSQTVTVVVTVPVGTFIGAQDIVTVAATSQGDSTKVATATLMTISDSPYAEPEIGFPTMIVYHFPITNTSYVSDSFSVSVDGNRWSVDYPLTTGPLPSGVSGNLPVTVSLPTPGILSPPPVSDTFTVTLTSLGDPTKVTTISHTTSMAAMHTLQIDYYLYLPLILRQ